MKGRGWYQPRFFADKRVGTLESVRDSNKEFYLIDDERERACRASEPIREGRRVLRQACRDVPDTADEQQRPLGIEERRQRIIAHAFREYGIIRRLFPPDINGQMTIPLA